MMHPYFKVVFVALLGVLLAQETASAQRGGRGRPGGGGGGMARPAMGGGGGMAHHSMGAGAGGMARPNMPSHAMSRPSMPSPGSRPSFDGMNPSSRPSARPNPPRSPNHPSLGNMSRPNPFGGGGTVGGGNRPGGTLQPGELTRPNHPGLGGGNLVGGNRPGGGGLGPGLGLGGGNRPGGGPGPGSGGEGSRPGLGGGLHPGGGSGERWPGMAGGGVRPGGGGSGERWPGMAGGGVRPGGGGSGERWPGYPGGGSGDRWPGIAGNHPGIGNRPITGGGNASGSGIGSGNAIGSGNIGHVGDNLGIVNRPNYGGNTFVQGGNTFNTNVNRSYASGYNNAPVIAGNTGGYGGGYGGYGGGYGGYGGGYGGYGGGWGGYGGYGRGYGGYGGGWAQPYYGNWYRGSFGNAGSFWAGFGTGALTSFGLSALYGAGGYGLGGLGYGGYGYGSGYGAGLYSAFPAWGMNTYSAWGLAPVASTWLYSGYANPYYTTVAAAQPAATTAVYDYSQPINVAAAPPDPAVADSTEQVFSAARDAFQAGDYQRALDLADQVLKQTPNVAVVHEFRALALFALKRYDEAASVAYAVLSAGPGWNWSTLVGLYPNVDTYTNQLRALEAYAGSNPGSSSARFLLGYHYMIEGHTDQAAAQFEKVTQLLPRDQLSASFVKVLRKTPEQAAQVPGPAPAPAPASAPASAPNLAQVQTTQGGPPPDQPGAQTPPPPPPPPASMAGTWKAQPAPDVAIGLTLKEDGGFVWDVDAKGQKQTLQGQAGFQDGSLILQQAQGPPLVGNVTQSDANSFVFAPPGVKDKGAGLVFTR